MSDDLLKTIITVIGGGLLTLAGLWVGKRPQPQPRRRKADKNQDDQLAAVLAAMQDDQMQWRDEVRRDLRKDLADARAEWAQERQRYIDEITALRSEVAMLRARIRELETGHG